MSEVAAEEKAGAELAEVKPDANLEGESQESSEDNQEVDTGRESDVDLTDAFFKEQGLTDETEGSDGEAKPDADTPRVLSEEEVERRVQAELAAERQRENDERQRQGIRNSFDTRITRLRQFLYNKQIQKVALTPQEIEAVLQEFTQHHGQSSLIAKEDATKEFGQQWANLVRQSAAKHVPGVKWEEIDSTPGLIDRLATELRKGYVPEKDVKASNRKAILDYKAYLETKGLLPGAKEVPGAGGAKGIAGRTPDAILDDPNSSIEDLQKAFKAKHGVDWTP